MFRFNKLRRHLILCTPCIFLSSVFAASQCKTECGIINIGQPKLWALADAQYLVGEAHERLKALRVGLPNESPAVGLIDPNAINLRQLDILLQALGIDVQYSQGDALKNQREQDRYKQELTDYEATEADRITLDKQIDEKTLTKSGLDAEIKAKTPLVSTLDAQMKDDDIELSGLRKELDDLKKAQTDTPLSAPDQALMDDLNTRIASLQSEKSTLRAKRLNTTLRLADLTPRRDILTDEIKQLTDQKAALPKRDRPKNDIAETSATQGTSDKIKPTGLLSELFKNDDVKQAVLGNLRKVLADDPKAPYLLQLSNVIDAYLQTISRRLTTLRQSVDPNYDLYFMELSASVTPSSEAKDHFARARWSIEWDRIDWTALALEYIDELRFEELVGTAVRTLPRRTGRNITEGQQRITAELAEQHSGGTSLEDYVNSGCAALKLAEIGQICVPGTGDVDLAGPSLENAYRAVLALGIISAKAGLHKREPVLTEAESFVFELSPAQGAVNIARSNVKENQFGIAALFKTLVGWGGGINYQRQRDTFNQFLQQEVFIAGYGKGKQEFGWDYGPMPGSDLVSRGEYTTFGVLAVPAFRRAIKFRTKGDWLLKPGSGGHTVAVGTAGVGERTCGKNSSECAVSPNPIYLASKSDFWIDSLSYPQVAAGEETSVILHGKGFMQEISVLVNNIPLEPRWRLIDPTTNSVSYGGAVSGQPAVHIENGRGQGKVFGEFEVLSADTLVMRFRIPDFEGIPQITIVSPHHSVHLNDLALLVNGFPKTKLRDVQLDFLSGYAPGGRDMNSAVMFLPVKAWPNYETLEFVRLDEVAQLADLRVRFRGIPRGAVLYLLRPDGTTDKNIPTFINGVTLLENVPTIEGDLQFRLRSPDNKIVYQAGRIPVPFRPRISSLSAVTGPAAGGTEIEIAGANLAHVDKVFFGSAEGAILARNSRSLRVRTPKGSPDSKVKVRIVSELLRDGKELANTEADKEFVYGGAPVQEKGSIVGKPEFGDLGTQTQNPEITFRLPITLPKDAGKPVLQLFNGNKWEEFKKVETLPDNVYSLSEVSPVRGAVRIRVAGRKDNADVVLLEEKTIDVEYTPELTPANPSGRSDEFLVLGGRNLQLVLEIRIGQAALAPISKAYDQVTFKVPDRDAAVPDGNGQVPLSVRTEKHSSANTLQFTYR